MVCQIMWHFCCHCKQPTTCLSQAFAHKSKQILLVSKVLIIYCLLCTIEKSYQQPGLRVSSNITVTKHLKTIKALGRFHQFLVFGYPDETLALVVDILHPRVVLLPNLCNTLNRKMQFLFFSVTPTFYFLF